MLLTGSDMVETTRLAAALAKEFEIKALGQLRYFLGLEVAYSLGYLRLPAEVLHGLVDFDRHDGLGRTVKVYTDADFGVLVDYRSTTGTAPSLRSLVSWKAASRTKCPALVCRVPALADGASEARWIYGILHDLRVEYAGPIHFFCDNKSAIALAKNPGQQGKIKHMEPADVLTKGLSRPLLQRAVSKLELDGMGRNVLEI
ncbi:uncharacterized protein LOC144715512 [Wolffia australiana]